MLHAEELLAKIKALAREFAADRRQRQQRRALDPADIEALKAIGLHLAAVPEAYGGWWQGPRTSLRVQCNALRLLAQGDPSLALVASMHPAVLTFWRDPEAPATGQADWEAQRRQVFASVIDGAGGAPSRRNRAAAAISARPERKRSRQVTRSNGGSPARNIRQRLRRDGLHVDDSKAGGGGCAGLVLHGCP